MSKRIELPIALETTGIRKGATDAEKALRDLEDAVGDAGKGGAKDLDQIEDELDDLKSASSDAGRKIGSDLDDGFTKAKGGAEEFKSEANSTAREAAASFDGSAESIGDAFQEVSANAFAGFGPAGAVAGIAAAAGLGLVTAELTRQQEEADKLRDRFADMYTSAVEDGRAYLDEAQIIGEAQDLILNPDRADEYKRIREDAYAIGVDEITLIRAMAGDEDAINTALDIGNDKRAERRDWATLNLAAERETGEVTDQLGTKMDGVLGKLQGRKDLIDQNTANARKALEVEAAIGDAAEDSSRRGQTADQQRWEAQARRYGVPIESTINTRIAVDTSSFDRALQEMRRKGEQGVLIQTRGGMPRQII